MPLTLGKAAIDFAHSNQIVALQALNPNKLGMTMLPEPAGRAAGAVPQALDADLGEPDQPGQARGRQASRRFLASDLDAAAILRVERGVPGDEQVARVPARRRSIRPEKKMIDYLAVVADNVSPLPPPPPKGAGEIEKMLLRFYPELAFGRMDVKEAAEQFYSDAEAILRRGLSVDVDDRGAARPRRGTGRRGHPLQAVAARLRRRGAATAPATCSCCPG